MNSRFNVFIAIAIILLATTSLAQEKPSIAWLSHSSLSPASGTISQLSVFPLVDTVGVETGHRIEFGLNGDTLQPGAELRAFYPTGFGLFEIDSARYSDDDPANAEFLVSSVVIEGQEVRVVLSAGGQAPAIGSRITLQLYGIKNAISAKSYQIALAISVASGELIATPAWSSAFALRAGKLVSFSLLPKGIQQIRAGSILQFTVETKDQYANNVSVQPIQWSVIGVPSPTGSISAGVFQARKTGASRIVASYQNYADTSNLVYVLPGEFAHFAMNGGSDSAVAGISWQGGADDVVVTAFDLFENVVYDYEGEIYFRSSDSRAQLPFTNTSRFAFETADQGRHVFGGSTFRFFTAGRHSLELMQNDSVMQTKSGITVLPAEPFDYSLVIPDTVMAGSPFSVAVAQARDQWGNPIAAVADLSLTSGSGAAPSGAPPTLPSLLVTVGSGHGSAVLVRRGDDTLQTSLAGVIRSHALRVLADTISRFTFELADVQTPERPFAGTALLTAYDRFGNVCDWFNAALDPVSITCTGSGTVLNSRIDRATAFVGGVCDLKTIGTGYSGADLYATFTATSQSGSVGVSSVVGFSYLRITGANLAERTRYIGEQYTFRLTVSDFGNQAALVDSIRLSVGNVVAVAPSVDHPFPDTIAPLSNRIYTFRGDVPNLPGESVSFAAKLYGKLGTFAVTDSADGLAEMTILPLAGVGVVSSSLSPNQVSRGKAYGFKLNVFNNGGDDLRLTTGSKIRLEPGVEATLDNPVVVVAHGGVSELRFTEIVIPADAGDLLSGLSIRLIGTLGSVAYDQTFPVTSPLVTQSQPQLSYRQGSLSPTTIFRGREVEFELEVQNSGTAALSIGGDAPTLSLFAGARRLDVFTNSVQLVPGNGGTSLQFEPLFIPVDFPVTLDSLIVKIAGAANGYEHQFRLQLPANSLSIPSGAAVKIVGTCLVARNAPYVNVGQRFEITATIRNQGDEPLRQIVARLISGGEAEFDDSLVIDYLDVESDTTIVFAATAALAPSASDLFSVRLTGAIGVNSGLPAQIMTPQGNTQVVVTQTPANMRLISSIASPADAQDGIVKHSSALILSASVLNNGQAGVGTGEVTLTQLAGSFTITSDFTQTLQIGQNVEWNLTAPATNDTAVFEIAISAVPEDQNIGMAAKVIDRADTITIISAEQQVSLGVDFAWLAPALLSVGKSYEVLRFDFDVVGQDEKPYLRYLDVALRDRGGATLSPSVLISSATLQYNFTNSVNGDLSENHIRFTLGENSGVPQTAVLTIALQAEPTKLDAVLYLDSNSFSAEYVSPGGPKSVPITARFASRLVISHDISLVPTSLEESFFSYPNPFSPVTEQATIVYSLSTAKQATLRIYTLTGDEVLNRSIPAPASVSEPVSVIWDGKNNNGDIVLNGVYIAVLAVEGMPEVRTKIAVVK